MPVSRVVVRVTDAIFERRLRDPRIRLPDERPLKDVLCVTRYIRRQNNERVLVIFDDGDTYAAINGCGRTCGGSVTEVLAALGN